MKHTPGPWTVESDGTSIACSTQVFITAPAPDGAGLDEEKANAALIAAAPELLDALHVLLEQYRKLFDNNDSQQVQAYYDAKAAITKAKGE